MGLCPFWNGKELAPAAGGIFFPMREAMGLDSRELTPAMTQRIVHAAAETRSSQRASLVLKHVGGNEVSASTVQRVTHQVGNRCFARLDYPSYRRQGLPVTSALMESLVKEVNYRVKGTEMFWNDPEGAEAILQVRAASLCDDDRLGRYLRARPGCPYVRRSTAASAA
jgi:hypothetical protein